MRKELGLILAIVFASSVVSGSLVFFGMQLGAKAGSTTVDQIEQAFDQYVQKQQAKQGEVAAAQQEQKNVDVGKNVKKVSADDHIRGDKNAKITLIEYSDYECPFCKRFHPTAQQIVDAYTGKVNWVYRYFPLDFHDPLATKEALAAECVSEFGGNDKFWAYTDLLYATTTSNGNGLQEGQLYDLAAQIGVDKDSVKSCVDSGKYLAKIKGDIAEGGKTGVTGTPGNILLNNQTGEAKLVEGAQPFNTLKGVIDKMLS
jgi:protein-disulfide isomerase